MSAFHSDRTGTGRLPHESMEGMGVSQARDLEEENFNKQGTGAEALGQRLLASLEVTVEEREDSLVSLSFVPCSSPPWIHNAEW